MLRRLLRLGLAQEERRLLSINDVCQRLGARVALMTFFLDVSGHSSMRMHLYVSES